MVGDLIVVAISARCECWASGGDAVLGDSSEAQSANVREGELGGEYRAIAPHYQGFHEG
jgi:hypothetical protein